MPSDEASRSSLTDEVQGDPLEGTSTAACAARLRCAIALADAGIDMMRQNLRRRNPQASDVDIARMLHDWLRYRPGAEHGDARGDPAPHRFA